MNSVTIRNRISKPIRRLHIPIAQSFTSLLPDFCLNYIIKKIDFQPQLCYN